MTKFQITRVVELRKFLEQPQKSASPLTFRTSVTKCDNITILSIFICEL
jgi:hypothetical protein